MTLSPEGEAEGDGLQDEGVRAAAAVHARVRGGLQGLDQPEAAHVHVGTNTINLVFVSDD
jgi:hypothetical protein